MVRVNKNRIKGELKKAAWKRFARLVENTRHKNSFPSSLRKVMTPAEIIALEKRLAIFVLLERGESYRAIGRLLDVTRVTISAVKRGVGTPPKPARPYASLPPRGRDRNHWMERQKRGRKQYYLGQKITV